MSKESIIFPKKYSKYLPQNWIDDADKMSEDDLKKVIIDAEGSIAEQENLKAQDLKLKEAKELVKDLGGAYTDSINYQKAKIKYAIYSLEKSGKL